MPLPFCLKRWETLTLGMLGILSCLSTRMAFSKFTFSKNYFSNAIRSRVLNWFDPAQDRHSVDPDLGTNCSQRLSAERHLMQTV